MPKIVIMNSLEVAIPEIKLRKIDQNPSFLLFRKNLLAIQDPFQISQLRSIFSGFPDCRHNVCRKCVTEWVSECVWCPLT